jgi:hypothetical protein
VAALAWCGRIIGTVVVLVAVGMLFGVTLDEATSATVAAGDALAKGLTVAHAGVERAVAVLRTYAESRR